ncbi:hypothetical protein [Pseudonocardia sp. KRD291]|uniref:hypothetical protein n=1 Tax=Pseudonocardia sp. KRD291 TaxID=2792007 RepID=UPI001C49F8E5|nr:hypothetical protein [Pseudonocardia sp. KRD291]MBW0104945.1 hypothetical protein [Pseudonocardia sp. KRD291]
MSSGATDRTPGYDLITLTSVRDNRAHIVTDVELSSAPALRMGRYEALCGHLIAPAPMVEPDGTRCPRCDELGRPPERRTQRGRPRGRGRRLPS